MHVRQKRKLSNNIDQAIYNVSAPHTRSGWYVRTWKISTNTRNSLERPSAAPQCNWLRYKVRSGHQHARQATLVPFSSGHHWYNPMEINLKDIDPDADVYDVRKAVELDLHGSHIYDPNDKRNKGCKPNFEVMMNKSLASLFTMAQLSSALLLKYTTHSSAGRRDQTRTTF